MSAIVTSKERFFNGRYYELNSKGSAYQIMYSAEELRKLKIKNRYRIRELTRVSFSIGVNLTKQTTLKGWLRVINVLLIISSSIGLYPHWLMIKHAQNDIPLIAEVVQMTIVNTIGDTLAYMKQNLDDIALKLRNKLYVKLKETSTTILQTTTSIVKMIYYLFMQHKFHGLLSKAETHELIQTIEIFKTDMPIKAQLKQEINASMDKTWWASRQQLIGCLLTCLCILFNYLLYALFKNLYHHILGTPDYIYVLPFTGYPMFLHKGMSSFYYPLDMFFGGSSLYIAGMGSVSFQCSFMVLCQHACGIVEVLNIILQRSTSPLVPKDRRVEYLRYCVIQHQRTLKFLAEVNDLFKHIILSQFLHSLAIYGFVLYEMSFAFESDKVTFVRMIIYFFAALTSDCMCYVNGQFLATELDKIPYAAYNCEWYNESEEFKKMLRMIIMRSNKVFCFQISWFGVITLATLMSILKFSYSYCIILQDMATEGA